MMILTNPPFKLCNNKRFLLEMQNKKDVVILATFKFCNKLGNHELIYPHEWFEFDQTIAIYSSYEEKNILERPEFYEKWLTKYEDGWVTCFPAHYTDPKSRKYNNLKFFDLTPDLMFAQNSCVTTKKGDPVKRGVYPKSVYKVYEKHKEQIFIDTLLWNNKFDRYVKIRKEFFDDYTD